MPTRVSPDHRILVPEDEPNMYAHKNTLKAATLAAVVTASAAQPAWAAPTLEDLDQQVKILTRKLEIADEAAATKAKEAPTLSASAKDGFSLQSADKTFQLKLRALVQADARFFLEDEDKKASDTFLLRRVRPTLEGALCPYAGFRVTPDFAGSQAVLYDAYGEIKFSPLANLRVGKFKPPVGLERLQSAGDTAFTERGLPTSLVPTRDVGAQLSGSYGTGVVDYAIGVFNGVPDGGNADVDSNDAKDLAARLFVTPFKNSDLAALSGLSFGIAGTIGDPEGTTNAPGLPSFRSSGQQSFFSYRVNATNAADTAVADGHQTRLAPQLYYSVGSLGLLGEYVVSEQDVKNGAGSDTLSHETWGLTASYVLTGESASYKGVQPLHPFDLAAGQWGALELVARAGALDIDDAAFTKKYADAKKSASAAESTGVGLNWYLTRNTKLALDYEQTSFDGGASEADRPDEQVVFTRLQVAF